MNLTREFPAKIVRWVDGDTCRVDIDQGFYDWKLNREVRLYGLDAPETRTKNFAEKQLGNLATQIMQSIFPVGSEVILISYHQERGKYGRVIGDIRTRYKQWSEILEDTGLAIPYGEKSKLARARHWKRINIDKARDLALGLSAQLMIER